MRDCIISVRRIVSESLKHLQIIVGCSFPERSRIQIYTPRLISLDLDCSDGGSDGLAPLLEKMPLLQSAFVMIGYTCLDYCDCNEPSCTCSDEDCVLLNGLSNAVHLQLTAEWKKVWFALFLSSCCITIHY
jgi:hypothetical protein